MISFPVAWPATVRSLLFSSVLTLGLAPIGSGADEYRELEILGWVENVWLMEPAFKAKAKLDSGAETSSLHAIIVKKFRKDDKRWVRFQVEDPTTGELITLVRERVRTIGIVQHDGDNQVRPVVTMSMCVAGRILDTEVSLTDRSQFNYPLLLGRNTLERFALIDPGNTFLSDKGCETAQAAGEPSS